MDNTQNLSPDKQRWVQIKSSVWTTHVDNSYIALNHHNLKRNALLHECPVLQAAYEIEHEEAPAVLSLEVMV